MNRILIVEDDEPKLQQLQAFLSDFCEAYDLVIAKSLNTACKRIDEGEFSLILLDMSLPTFDGGKTTGASGRQRTLGGKDLLRYLWELEIPTPVYVITGFKDFPGDRGTVQLPELDNDLRDEFPENYRGHVYFTHSNDGWKGQIREVLGKLTC